MSLEAILEVHLRKHSGILQLVTGVIAIRMEIRRVFLLSDTKTL